MLAGPYGGVGTQETPVLVLFRPLSVLLAPTLRYHPFNHRYSFFFPGRFMSRHTMSLFLPSHLSLSSFAGHGRLIARGARRPPDTLFDIQNLFLFFLCPRTECRGFLLVPSYQYFAVCLCFNYVFEGLCVFISTARESGRERGSLYHLEHKPRGKAFGMGCRRGRWELERDKATRLIFNRVQGRSQSVLCFLLLEVGH